MTLAYYASAAGVGFGAWFVIQGLWSPPEASSVYGVALVDGDVFAPAAVRPWGMTWRRTRRGLLPLGQRRFAFGSVGLAVAAFMLVAVVTHVVLLGVIAGLAAGLAPRGFVRAQARRERLQIRAAWPEALDLVLARVRSGDTLQLALCALEDRGPLPLRMAFAAFGADCRSGADFDTAAADLAARLGDPLAFRVVAVLRLSRTTGGSALGTVLRDMAGQVREDLAIREEAAARQTWIVLSARLAAAAPWVLLGLTALRPDGLSAFQTTAGMAVVITGLALTVGGYRLMLRLARLPDEDGKEHR